MKEVGKLVTMECVDEAIRMLSSLIQKMARELGVHHPATLEVQNELASLLAQCGRKTRNLEALELFKYLLETKELSLSEVKTKEPGMMENAAAKKKREA